MSISIFRCQCCHGRGYIGKTQTEIIIFLWCSPYCIASQWGLVDLHKCVHVLIQNFSLEIKQIKKVIHMIGSRKLSTFILCWHWCMSSRMPMIIILPMPHIIYRCDSPIIAIHYQMPCTTGISSYLRRSTISTCSLRTDVSPAAELANFNATIFQQCVAISTRMQYRCILGCLGCNIDVFLWKWKRRHTVYTVKLARAADRCIIQYIKIYENTWNVFCIRSRCFHTKKIIACLLCYIIHVWFEICSLIEAKKKNSFYYSTEVL